MGKETDIDTHLEEIACIKKTLPGWENAQDHLIKFQRLSGFTNITYRVTDLEGNRNPLVFKKFATVEGLLERQYENRILMQGSLKGIGPRCYFADEKYRIEESLEGAVHPSPQQLQGEDLMRNILKKVSEFHSLELDAIKHMSTFAEYILSSEYADKVKSIISKKEFPAEES